MLVECLLSILSVCKRRFRQLHHIKLSGPERICHFIRALYVLYNWAYDDERIFEDDIDDDQPEADPCCVPADRVCRDLYLVRWHGNQNTLTLCCKLAPAAKFASSCSNLSRTDKRSKCVDAILITEIKYLFKWLVFQLKQKFNKL